ncbi:MAG TPA: redoxin domain-containing protein [Solirubrobacteraceae bacterium]|jgi:cytochrome oxidase Cu insertion factor (SCO1/SenC/PrrC family)/thiol-disulfide isomerase/thioredoxin|nr:redoxin domain-containing protein [Solirubrobacteraceae bacterium]
MRRRRSLIAWVVLIAGVLVLGALLTRPSTRTGPQTGLARNPVLDAGTALHGRAGGFTLTDEFARRVSLRSFHGKVVILAFNDSQCTTVCPLTTTAMLDAKEMLGAAGSRVQLLGIDANPNATSVKDVRAYSTTHGMLHQWRFLTAPLPELERVWKSYGIAVQIIRGQIDHTPALFVIGPDGRLARLYLTQMSYGSIPQLGQLLAHEASSLLPGHPHVRSRLSYAQVASVGPSTAVSLPRAGGGEVHLGPGSGPRLRMFFATWDAQVLALRTELEALNRYRAIATAKGLPPVSAVDEGSVEPSRNALPKFLGRLSRPLSYPVAIDESGRVADGYQVQDEPWFVLTSDSGRVLWFYDVATQGPLSPAALIRDVRAALRAAPPAAKTSPTTIPSALAGSPAPLAALHAQAGKLVGSQSALMARLHALRGYPVVINAWASWCPPCKAEFPLFASAAARYGRKVAFVGVDTNDSAGDASSFLAKHQISYPSYQSTTPQLSSLTAILGLPTTIFVNRAGKIVHVHSYEYAAQGTLDQDIATYAR